MRVEIPVPRDRSQLPDTPAVRGMINRVNYLVRIED